MKAKDWDRMNIFEKLVLECYYDQKWLITENCSSVSSIKVLICKKTTCLDRLR